MIQRDGNECSAHRMQSHVMHFAFARESLQFTEFREVYHVPRGYASTNRFQVSFECHSSRAVHIRIRLPPARKEEIPTENVTGGRKSLNPTPLLLAGTERNDNGTHTKRQASTRRVTFETLKRIRLEQPDLRRLGR